MATTALAASPETRAAQVLALLAVAIGAALLYAPTRGHIDATDAFVYTEVTRYMVQDHAWLDLRHLSPPTEAFRDHLPFGFWPMALAARLGGEGALPPLGVLYCVATLAIVWRMAARLLDEASGAVAVLVLATTDTFFFYGGRASLDPPLAFWSSAGCYVVLTCRLHARTWLAAGLCTMMAVCVKGPFGGVPFCAAVLARAWCDRSWRCFVTGALVGALAASPVAAFLIHDRWWGHLGWWEGYVNRQLIASAEGRRSDGTASLFFPLHELVGRFWPGVPFVVLAVIWLARPWGGMRGDAALRRGQLLVVLFALGVVAILLLPQRKVWNHLIVSFPALAIMAGVGGGPLVAWLLERRRARDVTLGLVGLATLALIVSSASGDLAHRLLRSPPCVFSRTLRPTLQEHSGERLALVSKTPNWPALGELAVEQRLNVQLVSFLPGSEESTAPLRTAVIREGELPAETGTWHPIARAEGWVILHRP